MKAIIANSIVDKVRGITWMGENTNTRAAGLVMKMTKRVKSGEGFQDITFPISADVEGEKCYEKGDYFAMLPSSSYASILYVEAPNPLRFFGYDRGRKMMVFQDEMRLVVWGNMKQLGVTDYNAIDRIVYQITQKLTETPGERGIDSGKINVADDRVTGGKIDLLISGIEINNPSIFADYTINPNSFTYPYLYARFTLNCYLMIGKNCLNNITQGNVIC
jgi:hypothetical protein